MSRIFMPTTEGWDAQPLEGERYCLRATDGRAGPSVLAQEDCATALADALLLRAAEVEGTMGVGWALLTSDGARLLLNGEPVALGLALLRHRDELRLGGGAPVFLSTERLAAVEAYAGDDAPRCPRCQQPIARGELAVRCPGCGVRHHQLVERPCWTYQPKCTLCEQSSDLEAGLRWTPEEL
jgi:hypothetical protein